MLCLLCIASAWHQRSHKAGVLGYAQSRLTLCDPKDCSPPHSSVHGISRQEYQSGLLFPPPGIFPTQGSNPCLPCLLHWQEDFFTTEPPGKPMRTEALSILLSVHHLCSAPEWPQSRRSINICQTSERMKHANETRWLDALS